MCLFHGKINFTLLKCHHAVMLLFGTLKHFISGNVACILVYNYSCLSLAIHYSLTHNNKSKTEVWISTKNLVLSCSPRLMVIGNDSDPRSDHYSDLHRFFKIWRFWCAPLFSFLQWGTLLIPPEIGTTRTADDVVLMVGPLHLHLH